MKVNELIKMLEQYPPEMTVVVRGYEDGYDDVQEIRSVTIKHDPEAKWYNGQYTLSDDQGSFDAIQLFGDRYEN
jgi:hypothetical protein